MYNFSIGIMTQQAKQEYLNVLWSSLACQKFDQALEIILFSEESFNPYYPKEMEDRYLIKRFHYKHPFKIGLVRNRIAQIAKGKYLAFLDDDIALSSLFFQTLFNLIQKEQPTIIAGLTYQVFKRPAEFLKLYQQTPWEDLVLAVGKRDSYTQRIGRYQSKNLSLLKTGTSSWLGSIGRNMIIDRKQILSSPFIEMQTMGFEDLEFAYRMQQKGKKISLQNTVDLACLHLFHDQPNSKLQGYKKTFHILVEQKKLPISSCKWFFPGQEVFFEKKKSLLDKNLEH